MNEEYLEVNFEKYCKTCQHKELEEKFDPCNRCLEHGCNLNSRTYKHNHPDVLRLKKKKKTIWEWCSV